ncbi:unnamed protein product [Brassica oleracea]
MLLFYGISIFSISITFSDVSFISLSKLMLLSLNTYNLRHGFYFFFSCRKSEKERKVSEYYKKQEKLLEGFNEMETINETGFVSGAPASNREMKKLAKSERLAVHISNAVNLVLFVAKVYASVESRSLAVIASNILN